MSLALLVVPDELLAFKVFLNFEVEFLFGSFLLVKMLKDSDALLELLNKNTRFRQLFLGKFAALCLREH